MSKRKVYIAKAYTKLNTYFIYRENGKEVEVLILNGKMRSDTKLKKDEVVEIKKRFVISEKSKSRDDRILEDYLSEELTIREISIKYGTTIYYVEKTVEYCLRKKLGWHKEVTNKKLKLINELD